MGRPQIALLTDFGTRDHYVAAMKGVIAGRCDAPVHDLSHDIAPFDVFEAAWFLRNCARFWPPSTIFICVVDPGVGTARKIVAMEREERFYLAPDNGLLTFVDDRAAKRVSVVESSLFLPEGSTTFHGRDRFAPVAAAIANGADIAAFGPALDSIVRLRYEPPVYGDHLCRGTVVAIDRFGNLVTDLEVARLPFARFTGRVGSAAIDRIATNYGDAPEGAFFIAGSSGLLEISIAGGSAASVLGVERFAAVEISG